MVTVNNQQETTLERAYSRKERHVGGRYDTKRAKKVQ